MCRRALHRVQSREPKGTCRLTRPFVQNLFDTAFDTMYRCGKEVGQKRRREPLAKGGRGPRLGE